MTGPLIFSTHALHPPVAEALNGLGQVRVASAPTSEAIAREVPGAEIIVAGAPVPTEVVAREAALRAMVRDGAGLEMIPVELATAKGVLVASVQVENASSVAEHILWSALALLRNYPRVDQDLRMLGWAAGRGHADRGRELSGKTIGIVGMGKVGQATARIARHGFGMSVVYRTRRPDKIRDGVAAFSLDALLAQSDIVVLCCPNKPETRGLIHAGRIAKMKQGAILINVAEGAMVVERALVQALRDGRLGGAALDVHNREPLPRSHVFYGLPNVILTPRIAGVSAESIQRTGDAVVTAVRRIVQGSLPDNLENPEAVPLYQRRFGVSVGS